MKKALRSKRCKAAVVGDTLQDAGCKFEVMIATDNKRADILSSHGLMTSLSFLQESRGETMEGAINRGKRGLIFSFYT